ncbi:MAG TPA: chemotaxis protein CheC [Solirubrobacteraceae bacterium]|nr:chemotaxis protein CheC [Solirubrobacteraceae bacterium]
MSGRLTDMQLDALRELANISSGTAATSLSQMLGRDVDLNVPKAFALPLADAVDAAGDPAEEVTGIALAVEGTVPGAVLLLVPPAGAATLCGLLGVEPGSELADSALGEIGNILGAAYLNALGSMTGVEMLPGTPQVITDLLGAIVATVLAGAVGHGDVALVLDSELDITGEPCAISVMLLPDAGGVNDLLAPLGLSEATA